jgi:RNA polymerase sigma-70 factor (ECF subfamily)
MDQDSFRSFYDKTMPVLRAYTVRSCGSIEMADDILQEAFLRFLHSAPATLTEPQMRSYLYRTVEALLIDRWHGARREQITVDRIAREHTAVPAPNMNTDMERAFSQLDPKQRSLLWLAYVEGFNHKEIAATTNVGEKSVRVLLFRARKKLQAILKDIGLSPENL